jgi:hypothetical protein
MIGQNKRKYSNGSLTNLSGVERCQLDHIPLILRSHAPLDKAQAAPLGQRPPIKGLDPAGPVLQRPGALSDAV